MKYYFLPEDMAVLERTVEELRRKVKELGKEQGEAARQSTENFGHDDACQEAVDHERRITMSRLKELGEMANKVVVVRPEGPFDAVRLGATVELSDGRVLKIGSYVVLADHAVTNISYNSPLGKALLSKREGDKVTFREESFTVRRIS